MFEQGGWTRWPPEFPPKFDHFVILKIHTMGIGGLWMYFNSDVLISRTGEDFAYWKGKERGDGSRRRERGRGIEW